LILGLEENCSN